MWPLDSAKIDSVCGRAGRGRSARLARRAHGSTGEDVRRSIIARPAARRGRATTMSAPCSRSASAWPTPVDADDPAEAPRRGPASTPARASSNTAACAGVDAQRRARRRGTCRARACPAGRSRSATTPSTRASKRSGDARRRRAPPRQFALDDTTARAQARPSRAALDEAHRALVDLDAVARGSARSTRSFLRVPEAVDGLRVGGSSGEPSGSSIAREARKARTPSRRGLPSTYRRSRARRRRAAGRGRPGRRRTSASTPWRGPSAVCVSTPSRSKSRARMPSGRRSTP